MRTGLLADAEWTQLATAMTTLSTVPLFIDDTAAMTVGEMRAKARRLKAEHGLHLIIVDYLQLMTAQGRHDGRWQEVAVISRGLKALAKELGVPVVALSQVGRGTDARSDHRPQLSDLRDSGSLEQDADVVLFVYRDEVYDSTEANAGRAEIIIGKQRNGPTGAMQLAFMPERTRFVEVDE